MALGDYCVPADITAYGTLGQLSTGQTTPTRDDTLIAAMISNVSKAIDSYCGWARGFYSESLVNQIFTTPDHVRIDNRGNINIYSQKPVVQSVSSLAYKVNFTDNWTPIPSQYIMIYPIDPVEYPSQNSMTIGVTVQFLDWTPYRNQSVWIQASYVGGYAFTPPVINEACRELVWYFYKLREGIPMGTVNFPAMGMTVRPMDIPRHIAWQLDPWRRVWI